MVLTSTHNLCFGAKIRKIGIPLQTQFYYIKVGYKGLYISNETNEPCHEKSGLRGFRPGPTQTGLYITSTEDFFFILKVEELYYLCSENKGTDQLCIYCEADVSLFSHKQQSVCFFFHDTAQMKKHREPCINHKRCRLLINLMLKITISDFISN